MDLHFIIKNDRFRRSTVTKNNPSPRLLMRASEPTYLPLAVAPKHGLLNPKINYRLVAYRVYGFSRLRVFGVMETGEEPLGWLAT